MRLMNVENEVMRDRLGHLFESMSFLGDIKILQDNYSNQEYLAKKQREELLEQIQTTEFNSL